MKETTLYMGLIVVPMWIGGMFAADYRGHWYVVPVILAAGLISGVGFRLYRSAK